MIFWSLITWKSFKFKRNCLYPNEKGQLEPEIWFFQVQRGKISRTVLSLYARFRPPNQYGHCPEQFLTGLSSKKCSSLSPLLSLKWLPYKAHFETSFWRWDLLSIGYHNNINTSLFAWFRSLLNWLQVDGRGVFLLKLNVYGVVSPVLDNLFRFGIKRFLLNFKDLHLLRDSKMTEPFL